MIDVKKIVKEKLHSRNIIEPFIDKTFEGYKIKNNNYIEMDKFIIIIKDIHRTLHLPPPTNSKINEEMRKLNRKKDGQLKKEEYKLLIEDLIKVLIDSL